MKETSLSIEQIETLLAGRSLSPFYIRQNIVVPNVDWGFLNHEADLLVLSKRGYLTEVEIKRSWSDFVADFEKKHHHYDKKLSHFYYAVPVSIAQKVFDWLYTGELDIRYWYSKSKVTGFTENNPFHCGLIIYTDDSTLWCGHGCNMNVLAQRMGNYKVSDDEEYQLLRLLGMRVWKLKSSISKLQEKKKKPSKEKPFPKGIIESYDRSEQAIL